MGTRKLKPALKETVKSYGNRVELGRERRRNYYGQKTWIIIYFTDIKRMPRG